MKYEMMLRILFYLLARGKTSAAKLASRFDISTRSVIRYVNEISLAGIPIIADNGRNGGYYIADSYKITDGFMTKEEFDALITAAEACNEPLGEKHLSSAIDKLKSLYRPNAANGELKAGNFLIDFSGWYGQDDAKSVISVIEEAIENEVTVNIVYVDKNGNRTEREIEPHVIILKQGVWYIYAYCRTRKEFRTFKVSRIIYATHTTQKFTKRPTDINSLNNERWFEGNDSEYVDIRIYPEALTDVEEWIGVKNVYKNTDGYIYASCKLPIDDWLISKIASYGGKVEVISPKSLKRAVINRAKEILELYE